jgi:hypothetical protein
MTRLTFALFLALAACSHESATGSALDGGVDGSLPGCATITDHTRCNARPDCELLICAVYTCDAGDAITPPPPTSTCLPKGNPGRMMCPPPPSCPAPCLYQNAAACDADPSCYSVYTDEDACACEGCCLRFDHCQPGPPDCGPVTKPPPPCNGRPIHCGDQASPVYLNGCQIGCAALAVCR